MNNSKSLSISFYGSSLISAFRNASATYFRGILKELHRLGHRVTFYEPDAFDRRKNRDIEDPEYAKVIVYQTTESAVRKALDLGANADVLIKASGVGVFDTLLEKEILDRRKAGQIVIFWDVDAPATLQRLKDNPHDPFHSLLHQYDLVLTCGGGDRIVSEYRNMGVRKCIPIQHALDPERHFPVEPEKQFEADLALMEDRLPGREAGVEEFFLKAAALLPEKQFLLAGSGWADKNMAENIRWIDRISIDEYNAFNSTPLTVLNIGYKNMAKNGFSPAARVFEAAGAGACIITDAREGIELFLEPGQEVLVAKDSEDVASILRHLRKETAREIGEKARKRMLREHTYAHRALEVSQILLRQLNYQTETTS